MHNVSCALTVLFVSVNAALAGDPPCAAFPLPLQPPPSWEIQRSVVQPSADGPGVDFLYLAHSELVVHRGITDGILGEPVRVNVEAFTVDGAFEDLDGDGDLDVVVLNQALDATVMLRLYEQAGPGDFTLRRTIDLPPGYALLSPLDLGGDGVRDFIIAGFEVPPLTFLGTGAFTVVPGPPPPAGVWYAAGVDIDGDGDEELAWTNGTRTLSVARWDGAAFTPLYSVDGYGQLRKLVPIDLIPGAPLEIVSLGTTLSTFKLGPTTGEFRQSLPAYGNGRNYRLTDWDGDGRTDVLYASSVLRVFRQIGSGKLTADEPVELGAVASFIDVGDFDGDGTKDALFEFPGGLSIVPGRAGGALAPLPRNIDPDGPSAEGLFVIDFDRDGVNELIRWRYGPVSFDILEQGADGTFTVIDQFGLVGFEAAGLRTGDVDDDGVDDIVIVMQRPSGLRILRTILDRPLLFASYNFDDEARRFDLRDIDGDGDLDVAVAFWEAQKVEVRRNNGNGTFGAPLVVDLPHRPNAVVITDVNGDGQPDLVVGGAGTEVLMYALNVDDTFPAVQTIAFDVPGSLLQGMAAADFNADGFGDVVLAASSSGRTGALALFLADARGGFAAPHLLPTRGGIGEVSIADIDGDGRDDLVAGNASVVDFFRGHGDGTFANAESFASRGRLTLGDVTQDGRPDLLVASGGGFIHENAACPFGDLDGDGVVGFADLIQLLSAWGPCDGACPADFDGDGSVDLDDLVQLLAAWSGT